MNPFRVLVRTQEKPIAEIGKAIRMSPNTISHVTKIELPDNVTLATLNRLAGYFGYGVEVSLYPKQRDAS